MYHYYDSNHVDFWTLCSLRAGEAAGRLHFALQQEGLLQQTHKVTLPPRSRDSQSVAGIRDPYATSILQLLQPGLLEEFVPLQVFGDGNCLYRAVSRYLYRTEDRHHLLRLLTALEVAAHPDCYDPSRSDFRDLLRDARITFPSYQETLQVYNHAI